MNFKKLRKLIGRQVIDVTDTPAYTLITFSNGYNLKVKGAVRNKA